MGIGFSALFFAVPITVFLYLFLWLFRVFGKPRGSTALSWIPRGVKESAVIFGLSAFAYVGVIAASFRNTGSFEKDSGSGDYWRVPLEYPFQLSMVDGLESACLTKWDASGSSMPCIIRGVSSCAMTRGRFIGETGNGYIIYDFKTDALISVGGIDSLKNELGRQGIPFPELRTIREFYDGYWKSH